MQGLVTKNKKLNDAYYLMTIRSEAFVKQARVGQFLMIKAQQQSYISDPLLRRPFGICDVNEKNGTFKILYTIIGKGTQLLTHIKADEAVEFSEPLGNTFKLVKNKKVGVVAGGVGVAPLLWLTKKLHANGNQVTLFFGGRNEQDIVIEDQFEPYVSEMLVTTNDGSQGIKGLVTKPYEPLIQEFNHIYACGPRRMLRAVSEIAIKNNISVDVSLDERMACGIGACLGCIINVIDDDGVEVQKRCCVEGPVFDGTKIVWETFCK